MRRSGPDILSGVRVCSRAVPVFELTAIVVPHGANGLHRNLLPGVAGEFAGEAAGGDGEGGHDGLEFVAEVVDGEFDGGDDVAAWSEDGHGDAADAGFEFPAGDGDAGESGDGEGAAEPVG